MSQQYGDNFIPVIPVDYKEHSDTHPFCFDATCDCHDDPTFIAPLHTAYQDGLLTADEATNIVKGRGI